MKFVSYLDQSGKEQAGFIFKEEAYNLHEAGKKIGEELPETMLAFLQDSEKNLEIAKKAQAALKSGSLTLKPEDVDQFMAPIPNPPSCRDAYAFRQHVAAMRKNRGVEMIPEFDQFPIFYFTNHNAIMGSGDVAVEMDHLNRLDLELEVAIVVGKKGKNIDVQNADEYIFGYTIMNDFSARALQMEEMKLSLGPAKGKDFSTTIGPWLVTKDELAEKCQKTPDGEKYSLRMTAQHNGKQISEGNMDTMNWTFAQILERVSYGTEILPGDVIGSGTVGTGCYAELNGTAKKLAESKGDTFTPSWLEDGDEIALEIEGLGTLFNRIRKADQDYSILAKKKNV